MTPHFAKAVDPIFEYVLALLDRIEHQENPSPEQTQSFIRGTLLSRADQQLGQSEEWRLARYALVCWIDEMLTIAPWQGRDWWVNNVLEYSLFQTADRALFFFTRAKEAVGSTTGDALEVYYLCVILGYRGLYENPDANSISITAHDLPPTIHDWLQRTGQGIRLSPIVPIQSTGRLPPGAPPLGGFSFLTSSLVLMTMVAAIFCMVLLFKL